MSTWFSKNRTNVLGSHNKKGTRANAGGIEEFIGLGLGSLKQGTILRLDAPPRSGLRRQCGERPG